jgi:hypothetical protein
MVFMSSVLIRTLALVLCVVSGISGARVVVVTGVLEISGGALMLMSFSF